MAPLRLGGPLSFDCVQIERGRPLCRCRRDVRRRRERARVRPRAARARRVRRSCRVRRREVRSDNRARGRSVHRRRRVRTGCGRSFALRERTLHRCRAVRRSSGVRRRKKLDRVRHVARRSGRSVPRRRRSCVRARRKIGARLRLRTSRGSHDVPGPARLRDRRDGGASLRRLDRRHRRHLRSRRTSRLQLRWRRRASLRRWQVHTRANLPPSSVQGERRRRHVRLTLPQHRKPVE